MLAVPGDLPEQMQAKHPAETRCHRVLAKLHHGISARRWGGKLCQGLFDRGQCAGDV
ncbi:MAG: hypothetical protein ACO1TE_04800 [Prosthecobacter sp.]